MHTLHFMHISKSKAPHQHLQKQRYQNIDNLE